MRWHLAPLSWRHQSCPAYTAPHPRPFASLLPEQRLPSPLCFLSHSNIQLQFSPYFYLSFLFIVLSPVFYKPNSPLQAVIRLAAHGNKFLKIPPLNSYCKPLHSLSPDPITIINIRAFFIFTK